MNLADVFHGAASRYPDRPLLSWPGGGACTYGEAARAVEDQARELIAAGAPGARLGIMSTNRPELLLLWLAALRAGVTPVFLNPALTQSELAPIVEDLGVAVIALEDGEAGGAHAVRLGDAASASVTPMPRGDVWSAAARRPEDAGISAILLTGGSTGRPKYVGVPHAAYVLKGTLNALRLGLGPTDRAYCVMPMFHVGAQVEAIAPMIAAGGSMHLMPRFSASRFWSDLDETRTTYFHGTGSVLVMALAHGAPTADLALRTLVASLRSDLVEKLAEVLPAVHPVTLYGLTECPLATIGTAGDPYRQGWVGYPYGAGGDLRIAGPDEVPLADGDEGEIQLRNPACTAGYLGGDPSALFTPDGWLRTGDLGYRADGGLYLSGRVKEMIRRSGENVWPIEVEEALLRHPAVVDVAVVGFPDPVRDEEVRAFVEVAAGQRVEAAELHTFASRHLARYKTPRYVDFVDVLPKTAANKVDKPRLVSTVVTPKWDRESAGGDR